MTAVVIVVVQPARERGRACLLRAEPVEPEVVLTERFAALASHYLFEPCTCMQSGRKGPARRLRRRRTLRTDSGALPASCPSLRWPEPGPP